MRLLLIEDSPRLRSALQKGLSREGYAVDTAQDGREGLWLATENEYDVIVLDLMLPKIDGLTVLGKLRGQGKDTHVLILSAGTLVEDRVEGLTRGADDYLVKPFSFDELLARLQALVRRSLPTPRIPTSTLASSSTHSGPASHLPGPAGAADPARVQPAGDPGVAGRRGREPPGSVGTPLRVRFRGRQQRRRRHRLLAAQEARPARPQSVVKTRRGLGYLVEEATP